MAELSAGSGIVVLGAGGQAIETAALCADLGVEVVAFLDEPGYESSRRQLPAPIHTFAEAPVVLRGLDAVCAVGSPALRRRWAADWVPARWRTLVHPSAQVDRTARLGVGATVAPLACVGPRAEIGPHALVNVGASVAHETVIGAFATLGPGARIAGTCDIGEGALVGIAGTVSDKLRVGDGAIVGAGAVVISELDPLTVSAGNPATLLRRVEGWA